MESDDEVQTLQLTPKGFLCGTLQFHFGLQESEAVECWHRFEAFCAKRLRLDDPNATFPCLVFDGEGGSVIGAEVIK